MGVCDHFEANFKTFFTKFLQCGIPSVLLGKTSLVSASPKREVTRSWRTICYCSISVSFPEEYKVNSYSSYSCSTMSIL